jgi:guanine deaminase
MKNVTILKGQIVFTKEPEAFEIHTNSFLIAVEGVIEGIYKKLPEKYRDCLIYDYGNNIIIPGFVDLHLHAAQYPQCGMGMTKQLLDWLGDYTFDLEKEFQDPDFAKEVYTSFVDKLVACGTLRACIFASTSTTGTEQLFEVCKKKGIGAYVGKVNMDRNGPDFILESTTDSLNGTRYLLEKYGDEKLVKPIVTPRFAPTSSKKLLEGLGKLAQTYNAPVQSHLSENRDEIQWVSELFENAKSYADVYFMNNLFGQTKTLMAHGIYLQKTEINTIQEHNLILVHCPDSNINLRSGIMPVRKYLDLGLKVGLGSDIAGGHKIALNEAMVRAIQLSKILSTEDEGPDALTVSEVFYSATKLGGSFFGKVGSFEKGYSLDALVLKDELFVAKRYSLEDRLEKFIYTGDDRNIQARFVEGTLIE